MYNTFYFDLNLINVFLLIMHRKYWKAAIRELWLVYYSETNIYNIFPLTLVMFVMPFCNVCTKNSPENRGMNCHMPLKLTFADSEMLPSNLWLIRCQNMECHVYNLVKFKQPLMKQVKAKWETWASMNKGQRINYMVICHDLCWKA